jgi:hypothetical protein
MATWVACIIETKRRPDFWDVVRKHGVRSSADDVPTYVLIDCDSAFDFLASVRLAAVLSSELAAMAIGFVVQTTSDVHIVHAYVNGQAIRRLEYNRDDGGWGLVEGAPQAWERAYFFDDGTTEDGGNWPDLLADELSDDDVARYEEAKRAGDPSPVMALLHPSSTAPMWRVCKSFGIKDGSEPAGVWKKPSFFSRLFSSM